jgi:hypothetical protein
LTSSGGNGTYFLDRFGPNNGTCSDSFFTGAVIRTGISIRWRIRTNTATMMLAKWGAVMSSDPGRALMSTEGVPAGTGGTTDTNFPVVCLKMATIKYHGEIPSILDN